MNTKTAIQKPSSASHNYALHGLSLSASALRAIQRRGIYCAPGISIEHQHMAKRYVLRGVESGGAVIDLGRACAYLSPDGSPIPWLQTIDSIALNGRHAIILGEKLVRVEMLRTVRTCDLVITEHHLSLSPGRTRPEISSVLLFRGRDGVLPVDLWTERYIGVRGELAPTFYDRAGEMVYLPHRFEAAIKKITGAVCCIGCRHTHIAFAPLPTEQSQ